GVRLLGVSTTDDRLSPRPLRILHRASLEVSRFAAPGVGPVAERFNGAGEPASVSPPPPPPWPPGPPLRGGLCLRVPKAESTESDQSSNGLANGSPVTLPGLVVPAVAVGAELPPEVSVVDVGERAGPFGGAAPATVEALEESVGWKWGGEAKTPLA